MTIFSAANTERSMASVHDIITELEDDDDSNLQVFPQTRGNNGQYLLQDNLEYDKY